LGDNTGGRVAVLSPISFQFLVTSLYKLGHAITQSAEAMCYKLKGREFDSFDCIDLTPPAALWP